MKNIKEKITFYLSGLLYLLFNLRLAANPLESIKATLWQLAQTAPFIIGVTWVIVAFINIWQMVRKCHGIEGYGCFLLLASWQVYFMRYMNTRV